MTGVRFAAGGFNLGLGLVLVSLGRSAGTDRERRKCYGLAAWFLVSAPLQFLGGYLGHDCRPLRASPNLSLRYSHGPDRALDELAGSLLAEKACALRLRFRLLVFRVGQPHITSKDVADPLGSNLSLRARPYGSL